MLKIAHLADIHFRGLSRHSEYRHVFEQFFDQCDKIKPDHIVIAGDIVHSKTHGISPELVDILTWWFRTMASIAPTHVILGNHDGLMHNKSRQDAISPIINAINSDNLYLYKESGNYLADNNICFNVFSCFDEDNWDKAFPIPGRINIALYHGAVKGSEIETDWVIEGEVEATIFDGFDFAMIGDIHKRQTISSRWSTKEIEESELEKYKASGWEIVSEHNA